MRNCIDKALTAITFALAASSVIVLSVGIIMAAVAISAHEKLLERLDGLDPQARFHLARELGLLADSRNDDKAWSLESQLKYPVPYRYPFVEGN